jgi:hypothetical protein
MAHELIDALSSLSSIVDEENDRLTRPGYAEDLPALVAAKLRLAGLVEAEYARLARIGGDWTDHLDADVRDALLPLIDGVFRRLRVNAQLLERRMELCDAIMGAIAAEAQRLTGGRSAVYGLHGVLRHSEQPTPIAVNSRY